MDEHVQEAPDGQTEDTGNYEEKRTLAHEGDRQPC